MGACSSRNKEPNNQKTPNPPPNPPQEVETNLNSGQKQQPQTKEEPQLPVQKTTSLKNDLESLKLKLLSEDVGFLCQEANCDLIGEISQTVSTNDRKQVVQLTKAIMICLKELEQPIYLLDRKYPSEIIHNLQQLLEPSLEDLFNQNINIIKNDTLLTKGLELCCKTYHILQNLRNRDKVQKVYTEVVQDEELMFCEELKKQYLKLQSEIKLELIKTFNSSSKPTQQQNNPLLLMKFNTKHAITLAKQQTLKQSAAEDVEDSQLLQSLQEALDHYVGNDQYDTSDMKPSN